MESAANRLRERDGRYEIWDGDQLSERLRHDPDLVEIYFGRATKELYCRPSLAPTGALAGRPPTQADGHALSDLAAQVTDVMRNARRTERDRGYRDALGVAPSLPWSVLEQLARQKFELAKWLRSWKTDGSTLNSIGL